MMYSIILFKNDRIYYRIFKDKAPSILHSILGILSKSIVNLELEKVLDWLRLWSRNNPEEHPEIWSEKDLH